MTKRNDTLGVAIIGCGTVGAAAAQLLTRDADILQKRLGMKLELKRVVDLDFTRAREVGIDESLFCSDLDEALTDPSVGAVAELIGGTTFAKTVVEKSIAAGKHVVTANKALLAYHGSELFAQARAKGLSIGFDASCVGGVPVFSALNGGLLANRIDALFGIVNGTCNYILTQMTAKGQNYSDALADAQADGLAEADPTLDVGGGDSAHKLTIMASLGFGQNMDIEKIPLQGIDTLDLCDIQFGKELGYVIKLLAIAERQDDGISLRVRPAFIKEDHPLAWVSGPFNALSVYGHATGHTMYYGRGAGGTPTASAVVADLAAVGLGTAAVNFNVLPFYPDETELANQLPLEAIRSRYYLRMACDDRPGVLGKVTEVLGKHDISISAVLQHEPHESLGEGVPVIITTHQAIEDNVKNALEEIAALGCVCDKPTCIDIVEEYPEELD